MEDKEAVTRSASRMVTGIAMVTLAAHCLTNGRYDYFRDEFYYLACADHLAAGYVDHPPLSIWLLAGIRWLLGDSLQAIRLAPALAAACSVWLTGRLARELGGGRTAQALAALAAMIAPVFLVVGNFYSMNAFEALCWTVGAWLVVRIARGENPRLWLVLGFVIGVGLENKHSMAFFAIGLAVGLLLTPLRRHLLERWLWLAAGLAGLLFVPNLAWQIANGFPTLEFMRHAQLMKNAPLSPIQFIGQQVLMLNPLTLPLWLGGLCWYFATPSGRPYRVLGWIYLAVLALLLAQHGKAYYLAPAYPMLFAPGAIALEAWTRDRRRWLRGAYAGALLAGAAALAPLGLPILPVDALARYAQALGVQEGVRAENNALGQLPQHFADMFGWRELVATLAQVYHALPADEQRRCTIVAQNYGEAGAIDFFGKRYGLPRAISGHNNYWLWGPGNSSGEVIIAIGASPGELAPFCESVERVASTRCDYCMPFENGRPISVCRKLKGSLADMWARLKMYI
ncbi:MAG TPA: glycosyltransferase family 39 protein [Candidatus Binatia bacterium]|nr:glycosyltransferase family 39 protein [Candidatus Binatia bacterium]